MEEVDNIIIHTLKFIGCDIDEGIENIEQFTTELIVSATVKCLLLIQPDGPTISDKLPQSMSARFRLGSTLAEACKEIGYKGEIGYQTFLYASAVDSRKILMFLIEKLPKEAEKSSDEPIGALTLLNRSISAEINRRLKLQWLPSICHHNGIRKQSNFWHFEGYKNACVFSSKVLSLPSGYEDLTVLPNKETVEYQKSYMHPVSGQMKSKRELLPSIINHNASTVAKQIRWESEWNSSGLSTRLTESEYRNKKRQRINKRMCDHIRYEVQNSNNQESKQSEIDFQKIVKEVSSNVTSSKKTESSRFAHSEQLQFTQEEDSKPQAVISVNKMSKSEHEELVKQKQEVEQETTAHEIEEATSKLAELDLEIKKFSANIQQISEQTRSEEANLTDLKQNYKVKKQTVDLLPEADKNIKKLQEVVDGSSNRLLTLANQWESHRAPLINKYRALKELNSNKLTETQRKLEEIKSIREQIKENIEKTKTKEEHHKQLITEYDRMTKDINRSAYTRRILEIVGNIKKQKGDIDKVLVDTRSLQKEINILSGKLERTFIVTDELIFRDAKKDESIRKAYKYLAGLHEACDILIQTVEETGVMMREIRDLEDQIDGETQKNSSANLQRITSDFKQMKQENQMLMNKLKK